MLTPVTRSTVKLGMKVVTAGGRFGVGTVVSLLSGDTVGVKYPNFPITVTDHLTYLNPRKGFVPNMFVAD